jgi:DNA-binding transcriptional LysR family regulator
MSKSGAIDMNDLLVFAAVAEAAGFTAAADRLGTSKAQVSLQVRRLEAALGYELFHRTTRRITLTDSGSVLLATSVPHLRQALDAVARVPAEATDLSGSLKISCTVEHAVQTLARHLVEFRALHPRLEIDVRSSDRVVDLVRDGIDVALRMGWLRDSSLRAIKLGTFAQVVVAAPEYLHRAGTPKRPDDLAGHDWVALTLLASPLTWKFSDARGRTKSVRMRARIRTDNAGSLRSLVEAGAGVSVMDEPGARASLAQGRLLRLLPAWRLPEGGLYAVFPPGRHPPRQVRAFVDFYRARLA